MGGEIGTVDGRNRVRKPLGVGSSSHFFLRGFIDFLVVVVEFLPSTVSPGNDHISLGPKVRMFESMTFLFRRWDMFSSHKRDAKQNG